MTEAERIDRLEARVEGLRLATQACSASVNDGLALLAILDRDQVERLLTMRRLSYQVSQRNGNEMADVEAELIKRIEIALAMADAIASAGPLRPR